MIAHTSGLSWATLRCSTSRAPLFALRQKLPPQTTAFCGSQRRNATWGTRGPCHSQPRISHVVHASQEPRNRSELEQRDVDQKLILGLALTLTAAIGAAVHFGGGTLAAIATSEGVDFGGDVNLGPGDFLGGLLWSVSLYYASPVQLLLLFFGKIETERPSDGVLRFIGQLGGLRVDDIDYQAPAWVRAATASLFAASGFGVAAALGVLLGDASWSVSTGLGSCFAAGMYEVGRPRRLSVEEAQLLDSQYKDFEAFAGEKLQRSGRCHESEVIRGFRRQYGRYRLPSQISDATIRDMIRNWHPNAERTGSGYYKNLSLVQYDSSSGSDSEKGGSISRRAAPAAAGSAAAAAGTAAAAGSAAGTAAPAGTSAAVASEGGSAAE